MLGLSFIELLMTMCFLWQCFAISDEGKTTPKFWQTTQSFFDGYDSAVPPVGWQDEVMEMQIGFNIRKVLEINILDGTIKVNMWFRLKWLDERLLFDGPVALAPQWQKRGIQFIPVPQGNLWLPDVVPIGTVKNPFEDFLETNVYLYDQNYAKANKYNIFWSRPGTVDAKCDVDLKAFPFDTQRCSLRFESWSYGKFLKLIPMPNGFLQSDEMPSNEDFELVEIIPVVKSTTYNAMSDATQGISITIVAKRRPHYFVVNAIMPLALLMVLSAITPWLAFETDHSGSGERLSFSLTLLLTVFATMLFTAEKRPMLGHDTWLDQFQSWCVLLAILPILETGFIMWLDRHAKIRKRQQDHHEHRQHLSPTQSPRQGTLLLTEGKEHKAKHYCQFIMCNNQMLASREFDFAFRHIYPVCVFAVLFYKAQGMQDYSIIDKMLYHESLRSIGLFSVIGLTFLMLVAFFMIVRMLRQWMLGQPILPDTVRGWPGMDGFSDLSSDEDSQADMNSHEAKYPQSAASYHPQNASYHGLTPQNSHR